MAYVVGTILWIITLGFSIYQALTLPRFMPEIQYTFAKLVAISTTFLYLIFLLIVSGTKRNMIVFWIVFVLVINSVIVLWSVGYFKMFLYGIF